MSIIILKHGPHSMNSSFRPGIMTSTCLKSRDPADIIANHMKDIFCNYPPMNITNSDRSNTWYFVQRNKTASNKSHQFSRIYIINT